MNGFKKLSEIMELGKDDLARLHILLNSNEVCYICGFSKQTLYRRCKEGKIVYVKVKRRLCFELQALLQYIEENRKRK